MSEPITGADSEEELKYSGGKVPTLSLYRRLRRLVDKGRHLACPGESGTARRPRSTVLCLLSVL